jgi:hypothetical protein
LVGSHTILPLQLTSFHMVPQVTLVSVGSPVITQAPIGTPILPRLIPSLPPGYNSLNAYISTPIQSPSRWPNLFVPPGYHAASGFVPTPTQVLSRGSKIPSPPLPGGSNCHGPSSSNKDVGTSHFVASGFQIPIGGQPQVGGHNPMYMKYIPGL